MFDKLLRDSPMNLKSLFILLAICIVVSPQETGDLVLETNTAICWENNYWNCAVCSCPIEPVGFFTWAYFSINLTGIVITLLVILLYLMVREVRTPPGDLIAAIAMADFIWGSDMALMDIYRVTTGITKDFTLSNGCIALSAAYLFSKYMRTCYTIAFFLFYLYSLKFSLKGAIPQAFYHLGPIMLTAFFLYSSYSKGGLGYALYGTCSAKTNIDLTWTIASIVIFIIVPIYTLYYTDKYAPRNGKYSKATKEFLDHYRLYVILASLISLGLCVVDVIEAEYAVSYWEEWTEDGQSTIVDIAKVFGACLKACHTLILSGIRLADPMIKKHLHKLICCLEPPKDQMDELSCPMRGRIISMDVECVQMKIDKSTYLSQIQHSLKVQVIYTILSSLHFFWNMNTKNKAEKCVINTNKFYQKEAKIKQIFKINQKILEEEIPEVLSEIKQQKYVTVDGILTVYASSIFDEVIDLDDVRKYMANSLDLKKNLSRILKAGINTGGKSGEFFFFSADNRLIIKTITDSEVKALISMLPDYAEHFKNNPYSTLAKIYGAFTFERFEPREKYNLILMRNLNGYPSSCIERKYDLKGSTVGRITIKGDKIVEKGELKYYDTLKDLDFNRYEKKLWIDADYRGPFFENLKKDVAFLSAHGLIDYSLAVYMINRDSLNELIQKNDQSPNDNMQKSFMRWSTTVGDINLQELLDKQKELEYTSNAKGEVDLRSIKSNKENLYYHIGIIDYLIVYDCKKVMEKFSKKLGAFNPNYDISVQSPNFYAERFIKYIQSITF